MKFKIFGFSIVVASLLVGRTFATTPKSITYKGLTLTPAIQKLELTPTQPNASFKIKLENRQSTSVSLTPSSLDFKSLNDTGGVAFIGSGTATLEHKYGLANWINLPSGNIILQPNTSQDITVTLDNRSDLSPGGHYAAVLFKNNSVGASNGNKVNFNQVVATLVFVKKSGGELYNLQLPAPKIDTRWFSLPSTVNLFIINTGNTQTVPRGVVSIQNLAGTQFKKGVVNTDSALVLPESTRFYPVDLFSTAHAWLPGRYKAVITVRPDDIDTAQTQEFDFFYVNLPSLAVLAGLVLIASWWWRYLRLSKRHKNHRK